MAVILRKVFRLYDVLFNELSDPRADLWPLMGSPLPVFGIIVFYLYFVKSLGPRLMKYREPFKLKNLMLLYNAGQVVACIWVVYRSIKMGWGWRFRLVCEPVDLSRSQHALDIMGVIYLYFAIKLTDLFDTVFFVLRKKNNHVSFLHVYHHTGMVVLAWSCMKFIPGGHGTLLGVINSVVHIVMYSYYLMTLIDQKYARSLWWKKYITQIQLVQFFLLVIHFSTLIVVADCEYPRWVGFVIVPQNLFMLLLFGDFYRKAYLNPKTVQESPDSSTETIAAEKNSSHCNGTNGVSPSNGTKLKSF